jgi:hypothetical protein
MNVAVSVYQGETAGQEPQSEPKWCLCRLHPGLRLGSPEPARDPLTQLKIVRG